MVEKKFSVYLGNNTSSISAGFDVEGSFMCVLEINHSEEDSENMLRATLETLRKEVHIRRFDSLQNFGTFIQDFIITKQVSSLAALYIYGNSVYAVTHRAHIYLNRHAEWFVVAQGNQQSVGEFAKDDLLLLCTETLINLINPLTIPVDIHEPKNVTDYISQTTGEQKMIPAAGMAVTLDPKIPQKEEYLPPESPSNKSIPLGSLVKKLRIPLFLFIVILVGWKTITEIQKVISSQREVSFTRQIAIIAPAVGKLQKALLVDPKMPEKAKELKIALTKLLQVYPEKKTQLQSLLDSLSQITRIFGDTHASADSLFFDLRLIDQKAQVTTMAISTNSICMLDIALGKAYVVAIDSKKQDSYQVPDARNVQLIGCVDDVVYVFNSKKGIAQISSSGVKNIIAIDNQWGKIQGMQLFNSNIYLLDTTKDEIFKYIPIENGYSDALSYFQTGSSMRLKEARSFAIDFSVYILTPTTIAKYTGGIKDPFLLKTSAIIPHLSAIYKNSDTTVLYGLIPIESRVIAIDKNGEITKSIFNPKLRDVKFFGVYQDSKILFLYKNGIYVLDNF